MLTVSASRARVSISGLGALHHLTKTGNHELRVDMIEHDGSRYYAKYRYVSTGSPLIPTRIYPVIQLQYLMRSIPSSQFKVGPAWNNYKLQLEQYSGNASNQMNYNNNRPFSTKDADHDSYKSNCAVIHKSGNWFGDCHNANLNGPYTSLNSWHGVVWNNPSKIMHMRFAEMKFREIR